MEAEKPHNLPSASWKVRKSGAIIQPEAGGLKTGVSESEVQILLMPIVHGLNHRSFVVHFKIINSRDSLGGLALSKPRAEVQSLVRELRY